MAADSRRPRPMLELFMAMLVELRAIARDMRAIRELLESRLPAADRTNPTDGQWPGRAPRRRM